MPYRHGYINFVPNVVRSGDNPVVIPARNITMSNITILFTQLLSANQPSIIRLRVLVIPEEIIKKNIEEETFYSRQNVETRLM